MGVRPRLRYARCPNQPAIAVFPVKKNSVKSESRSPNHSAQCDSVYNSSNMYWYMCIIRDFPDQTFMEKV